MRHLGQLHSSWVVFEGERYLIIPSQSCIQVEVILVDSVEKVKCTIFFKLDIRTTGFGSLSISDDSPSPSCDTHFMKAAAAA